MNHEQVFHALAYLIMSYVSRDDIQREQTERHLFCAETLRKAQCGEITYLEAAEVIEASAVASGAF